MTPLEWWVFGGLCVLIGGIVVYHWPSSPDETPADEPVSVPDPEPVPDPVPPPPPTVSIVSNPEKFAIRFLNPPTSITGSGRFEIEVVPLLMPNEVANLTGGKVHCHVKEGSQPGTVSSIREIAFNPDPSAPLGVSLSTESLINIPASGRVWVNVVSRGTPGADQLWAQVLNSTNYPITADYEITPPP